MVGTATDTSILEFPNTKVWFPLCCHPYYKATTMYSVKLLVLFVVQYKVANDTKEAGSVIESVSTSKNYYIPSTKHISGYPFFHSLISVVYVTFRHDYLYYSLIFSSLWFFCLIFRFLIALFVRTSKKGRKPQFWPSTGKLVFGHDIIIPIKHKVGF